MSPSHSPPDPGPAVSPIGTRQYLRVALASGVGTVIEQYDFLLFGTAAGLVFDKLFFPTFDPRIGLLLAFATYGTGSVARPIGGVVIAHFGDRIGRKQMLVLTLGVTGLATALIGVLPGYATLGVWAPIALTALRVIQGFFLGGEQGGAFVLVSEHAPAERRGWYGGFATAGSPAGQLLGVVAFTVASMVSGPAFLVWAWRIPFLFSVVLVAVALYVRVGIAESPTFAAVARKGATARVPIVEALRRCWRTILLGAGVNVGTSLMIYICITFAIHYLNASLGLSRTVTLVASLIGAAGQLVAVLVAARLSDRLGRVPVMLTASVLSILFVFPFFVLLGTRIVPLVVLAMLVAMALQGALFGPMAAYYSELFDTEIRYTGVATAFSLGVLIGGGLAPPLASGVFAVSGGQWWPVACLLIAGAAITVGCLLAIGDPNRRLPEPVPNPLAPAEAHRAESEKTGP